MRRMSRVPAIACAIGFLASRGRLRHGAAAAARPRGDRSRRRPEDRPHPDDRERAPRARGDGTGAGLEAPAQRRDRDRRRALRRLRAAAARGPVPRLLSGRAHDRALPVADERRLHGHPPDRPGARIRGPLLRPRRELRRRGHPRPAARPLHSRRPVPPGVLLGAAGPVGRRHLLLPDAHLAHGAAEDRGAAPLQPGRRSCVLYFGGTDALGHVRGWQGLEACLRLVDQVLRGFLAAGGGERRVVLFSDHGTTAVASRRIDLGAALAKGGFRLAEHLERPGDVVAPAYGLVGGIPLYTRCGDEAAVARAAAARRGSRLRGVARRGRRSGRVGGRPGRPARPAGRPVSVPARAGPRRPAPARDASGERAGEPARRLALRQRVPRRPCAHAGHPRQRYVRQQHGIRGLQRGPPARGAARRARCTRTWVYRGCRSRRDRSPLPAARRPALSRSARSACRRPPPGRAWVRAARRRCW